MGCVQYVVWGGVLPDIGSLAMQRMLGRGMTINCFKFSCNTDNGRGFEGSEGQGEEEEIHLQSHKWWISQCK